jgi:hypothetical protein
MFIQFFLSICAINSKQLEYQLSLYAKVGTLNNVAIGYLISLKKETIINNFSWGRYISPDWLIFPVN